MTRIGGGMALVALTLFFNLRYLSLAPPITTEEHFLLGEHLHATGVLSIDEHPSVFRAPGFPAFVALVLHLRDRIRPGLDGGQAVAVAHAVLLSAGAAFLFLHALRRVPFPFAFLAGILYALNPLNIAFGRTLTYSALHMALVLLGAIALSAARQAERHRLGWALGAGLLWGVATLVRPVSLVLPPFVLLLARWQEGRGSWRSAFRFAAVFTLGMAAVIAPYSARNYAVTHRLVVVNAQEGYAVWGLTAARDPFGDMAEWFRMWRQEGEPLFTKVTGEPYSIEALYRHQLPLNDAFREEARRNVARDPWRVARNVVSSLAAFNVYFYRQWVDGSAEAGDAFDWSQRTASARVLIAAIVLLGAFGLVRGLRAGEPDAKVVLVLYLMFLMAHATVVLMARYTYVVLPLLMMSLPLAVPRIAAGASRRRAFLIAAVPVIAAVAVSLRAAPRGIPPAPTRAEIAKLVLARREGRWYEPPSCAAAPFADVAADSPDCPWIAEIVRRGTLAGCGGGRFCPTEPVTREQMALAVLHRSGAPALPACGRPIYTDVPASSPFCPWIEELTRRGLVSGCGGSRYCPEAPVTRGQARVFLGAASGD